MKEVPDAVVAYNYPSVALNKLRKFCKGNHIKLYADCTEWYQGQGNILARTVKNLDTNFRMKYVQPKLNGVIVISKFLFDYYKAKETNLILLPPLVDTEMEKWRPPSKEEYAEELQLVYAGSPGMGSKDKLDKVINALSIIRKQWPELLFKFTVIGLTRNQFLTSFNIKTLSKEDENHFNFLGHLSHLESIKEIQKANFQIFIREENLVNTAGFPTKFVEAITSGTPVLTNLSSNIGDYLIDGVNGFILDLSSENKFVMSLKNAFSQSKEKLNTLKRNCRENNPFEYRKYIAEVKNFLDR